MHTWKFGWSPKKPANFACLAITSTKQLYEIGQGRLQGTSLVWLMEIKITAIGFLSSANSLKRLIPELESSTLL